MIREIKKLDEYSAKLNFLTQNSIKSKEDLEKLTTKLYEKMNPLKSERENLWKKYKKAKSEDEKNKISQDIVEISKAITPIANKIKMCNSIAETSKDSDSINICNYKKMESTTIIR